MVIYYTSVAAATASAAAPKPAKARVKVYITDGKTERIETDCQILYFIKTAEKPLTLESTMLMHKVIFDISQGNIHLNQFNLYCIIMVFNS